MFNDVNIGMIFFQSILIAMGMLYRKKIEYKAISIFIDIFFCNNSTEIYIP